MDTNKEIKRYPNCSLLHLEEYILGLVKDSKTLDYDLTRSGMLEFSVIEFYVEIPEQPNTELLLAQVSKWLDISRKYNKPVRVYSYVYNVLSEKAIMRYVAPHDELFITIIPGYLKK